MPSHGDTQLGGDDFDQLLLDHICDAFGKRARRRPEAVARPPRPACCALRKTPRSAFRSTPVTTIEEEFIAEKNGKPLNLVMEINRYDYEELIQPAPVEDARRAWTRRFRRNVQANQIDKVVLVGGATRTPLVHELLEDRLGRPVHCEIEPDLAVAMGAAVQGGLIAGIDVGPILVDITPHTLGISALGELYGFLSPHCFSPIIPAEHAAAGVCRPRSTRPPTTTRKPQKSGCFRVKTATPATTHRLANS